jgi:hypothetical protein
MGLMVLASWGYGGTMAGLYWLTPSDPQKGIMFIAVPAFSILPLILLCFIGWGILHAAGVRGSRE